VKVGLFLDLRNPAPWRRSWPQLYRDTLDRVVAAERLGADAVWLSEHHFFDDGYLPQPLTFAAAVAAVTTRIRIGTAVLLAALRHPVHVAEEAAVVDLVSGGRLELGVGAGWSAREYAAFGADMGRRYGLTDGAVAEVRRLLDGDGVTPPPVQRPFPLWLGYQGPQGARRAGRLGVGLLSLHRALLEPYRAGLEEGGYDPAIARMGGVVDIVVARDPEATRARLPPYRAHQVDSYRERRAQDAGRAHEPLSLEALRPAGAGGLHVLTPEDAVAAIREHTDGLPVEHVYLWLSIGGMPDDLVDEHLELTMTAVRPALVA
jgi:alkanesulfonate monooxygenase SsuD/methylene tetrahydromethanopterin reductase-like flavin-dependent oxidoreductase (luciferase family)